MFSATFWLLLCMFVTLTVSFQGDEQDELRPIGFSKEERRILISLHNDIRRKVSPIAANMGFLRWDMGMEKDAADLASRCDMTPDKSVKYGQNLHQFPLIDSGKNFSVKYSESWAVLQWQIQHKYYDYNSSICSEGKNCSNYVQLILAEARYFACSVADCPVVRNSLTGFSHSSYITACVYDRTISDLNKTRPYEAGPSCSRCPEDMPSCDETLSLCRTSPEYCSGLSCNGNGVPLMEYCECDCEESSEGPFCRDPIHTPVGVAKTIGLSFSVYGIVLLTLFLSSV